MSHRGRLGEYTLAIARSLGYTGVHEEGDDDRLNEVMDFFQRFSPDAQTAIFDLIVISSETGLPDLSNFKTEIMEFEHKHGGSQT